MRYAVMLLTAAWLTTFTAKGGEILFRDDFSDGDFRGWQNTAYFKTPTSYAVQQDGTNFYVQATANKTCSALTKKLNVGAPKRLVLRWKWKIEAVNTNGSERDIKKFDHAARVFVAFDTFVGPPRTLNYMWGNQEPAGSVLAHPKSERAQIFVLQSGNGKAGQWIQEERDVTADWQRVFADKKMPKITGLGLMTDDDSLGMPFKAEYADIELIAE